MSFYRLFGKRVFDLAVAVPACAVAAPVVIAAAVGVRATMGAPAFYVADRPGLHGKPFRFFKLRTMRQATDVSGRPLPDDERLTSFGKALRAASIDELPQLLHVLTGEMSLVGPRPLLMHYRERYSAEQARRHDVKPGITGQAQVNGRNALSWDDKFRFDVWYVDHLSFALDLVILAKTLLKVLDKSGITAGQHATMPEFTGSSSSS